MDASKNKSIYEGIKHDYENLNNSLGSYSNHVNSALDFIFGAGSDCENGGFISGTQILGGDLIYDIQGDLEKSLESLREVNPVIRVYVVSSVFINARRLCRPTSFGLFVVSAIIHHPFFYSYINLSCI